MKARIAGVVRIGGLFILLSLATAWTMPSESTGLRDRLHPIVERAARDLELPGLAVSVITQGQISYLETFGVDELVDKGSPVTSETLFQMASVTKTFVATAVMQLVEQGKVDLDAPVSKYLPYFEGPDERYAEITVRHLLSHLSGIANVTDPEFDRPQFDDEALERYVKLRCQTALIDTPGSEFHYSNIGYSVLGDLIAKVSGEIFENYVKKHILNPLGMKQSTLLLPEARRAQLAQPHIVDNAYQLIASPLFPYNRTLAPASTLYSNIREMTRWALANLNRGVLDGERILPSSAYDLLWRPVSEKVSHMGLGWFLWSYRGERMIGHSGSDLGYVSDLQLMPDRGIAVVVMINRDRGTFRPIVAACLDAALGLDPKPIEVRPSLAKHLYEVLRSHGLTEAIDRYQKLKDDDSSPYDFNEWVLNDLGYRLLRQGRVSEAVSFFEVNLQEYPDSPNAHDSLADGYFQSGLRDRALLHYRKSLELNPKNTKAEARIRELEKGP